jgi:hypothetical protein
VDLHARIHGELGVLGHFSAVVPGEGAAQLLGQPRDGVGQGRPHASSGEPVREWERQHGAAVALDQGPDRAGPLAEHQLAFPMPGHGPVGRLSGSLADMQGAAELPTSLRQPLAPWVAHRPTGAQTALQLTAQRTAALDEQRQVDGLVRHPHHRILGVGQRQPAGDLLGRPPQGQLGLHTARSRGWVTSLATLGRWARPKAAASAAWAR